ncbi:hypothetical protein ppKF707_4790 [Metapseudomonas furukawaii]|uniref:Uncharacterized protein n=1 Tax=Metapseudomonas furukawaii TaxID=1149133 RepID=A0AAD1C327_METFU|nr:hypothetical protein ppKF707_4790 [Pseudomonas furukawaii]BAU74679.1 hypothetical protein KF707C_29910 [Pseudomonas furukawaii]
MEHPRHEDRRTGGARRAGAGAQPEGPASSGPVVTRVATHRDRVRSYVLIRHYSAV